MSWTLFVSMTTQANPRCIVLGKRWVKKLHIWNTTRNSFVIGSASLGLGAGTELT